MPAMFVFLFKVNIALLLFCAGYYAVLRHLTFYNLNRVYLMVAILFATVYPKINIDSFAQKHQQLTQPVQVILNFEAPAQTFVAPIAKPDYWYYAEVVFWIGASLLAMRLLMQLYSLYKMYRASSPANIHGYDVRTIQGDNAPFSFWKSIYLNPDNHNPADLHSILLHEQVHVSQLHTLDILLAELSTIFYWFNPGIWLIKKAVRENIEFITDNKILNKGVDSKAYQYSLVNASFNTSSQSIVNHFNLSTIKQRIIMMNAKRSSRANLTRYAFLMPAVIVLLLVFSISKAAFISKSSKAIMHNIAATISNSAIINNDILSPKPAHTTVKSKKAKVYPTDTVKTAKGAMTIKPDDTLRFKKGSHMPVVILDGKVAGENGMNWVDPNNVESVSLIKSASGFDIINITSKIPGEVQAAVAAKKGSHTPVYVVNGKVTNEHDLNTIDPNSVASVNIIPSVQGVDIINMSTKIVPDGQVVQAAKINGQLLRLKGSKVINGNVVVYDTIRANGRIVIDTVYGLGAYHKELGHGGVLAVTTDAATEPNKPKWKIVYDKTADLSNLTSKVFVIDGKTATQKDVKKLSMLDIDRITVKNDEENKSLYGDKAKNGVVFVVTKKKK